MKKFSGHKQKNRIICIVLAVCLLLSCGFPLGRRIVFFKNANVITAGEKNDLTDVAKALSKKIGITLDANVSAHRRLLERYDDIEIKYELETINIEENRKSGKLRVYSGVKETDYSYVHFALIDGLNIENGEPNLTAVFEIHWKTSFKAGRKVELSCPYVWQSDKPPNPDNDLLLCYYSVAKTWIEAKHNDGKAEYYPKYITPFETESCGCNTMVQLWRDFTVDIDVNSSAVTTISYAVENYSFLGKKGIVPNDRTSFESLILGYVRES